MISGKSYIGYEQSSIGSSTYSTYSSAKGRKSEWVITEATQEEIEKAVEKAVICAPKYAVITPIRRAEFLMQIAKNLELKSTEIIEVYCFESSLPQTRARAELDRTIAQLNMFSELLLSENYPEVVKHIGVNDLRKTYFPIGPIAVFGSSNFPLAYSTIGGDSVSALASGCPVLVKAHPLHAGTGELVAKEVIAAAQKSNLPDGVFSNLNIRSHELGAYLVAHDGIRGVGFTGSLRGGRALFDVANQRVVPIPFFAEMGSLNPVCIHPSVMTNDGVIAQWAVKYANSISDGAGQFCTKPGIIFGVRSEELDTFKIQLSKALREQGSHAMLHPDLFTSFSSVAKETMKEDGVNTLSGSISMGEAEVSSIIMSTSAEVFIANPSIHHEMFGPAALLVECDSLDQMLRAIETLDGQLTGTLLYEQPADKYVHDLFSCLRTKAGRVIVNGVPTGVEVCEAMNHGGPYPATTDSRYTAVGTNAIRRWLRPVVFQNVPEELLPPELI